ncbi:MAG: lanthionine synthetase LanC family protein [Bacteroidota bacterium]
MESAQIQQKLLHEAEYIGYEIIRRAKKDEFGIYWDSLPIDTKEDVQESIFAGDAGIILFLSELAKQSSDTIFDTTVNSGLEALYNRCLSKPTDNYAFYTGRAGVAYLCSLLVGEKKSKNYRIMLLTSYQVVNAF